MRTHLLLSSCAIAFTLAGVLLSAPASSQAIYKCKDATGKTVYSQTPCAAAGDASQQRFKPTMSGSIDASGSKPGTSTAAAGAAAGAAKKPDAKADAPDAAVTAQAKAQADADAQRKSRCNQINAELSNVASQMRAGATAGAFEALKQRESALVSQRNSEKCHELR